MVSAHSWRFLDASGEEVQDVGMSGLSFPTQAEAEAWMGEQWPTLADAGVEAVTLVRDSEVVYGPMSLSP
ncbi:MAG TPA: hypothetical protein VJ976_05940 [Ornithinimicrobium sp.]|uniref:hypothetical protein n=1 Tax=Ornithinimicrobium sp. TaxID=1977084 RepID=UPI002B48CF99|nr:hypothetical protein [Ornithinimicrobium sp.]HKJ11914.1 hypothetical protein [Ornithinimicrobium sp.]